MDQDAFKGFVAALVQKRPWARPWRAIWVDHEVCRSPDPNGVKWRNCMRLDAEPGARAVPDGLAVVVWASRLAWAWGFDYPHQDLPGVPLPLVVDHGLTQGFETYEAAADALVSLCEASYFQRAAH